MTRSPSSTPLLPSVPLTLLPPCSPAHLLEQGYGKVLAKGRLPETPFIVKARYVSKRAEEKLKEAGGVVVISA